MLKLKKIRNGAFRELGNDECRILFIRHADHRGNVTTERARRRLRRQGNSLREAGLIVSSAISSPADRAIIGVYETKAGMGCGGHTFTDKRLGDLKMESAELLVQIRKAAKETGISAEVIIYQMADTDDTICRMLIHRAIEGASALRALAKNYPGRTTIAGSHGGSRMEAVILELQKNICNDSIPKPEYFIVRGCIVEIILNAKNGELVELHYLQHPDDTSAA